MCRLKLTAPERSRLVAHLRTAPNVRVYRKTLAILEIDRAMPIGQVARMLHVHRDSIYRWISAYMETRIPSSLDVHYHGSLPAFWSDEAEATIRQALERSPDEFGYRAVNWTVPLLQEHINKLCGTKPSDRQVRKQLRELNYVWKRPRHALPEAKSPRVKRRLRLIRKKVKNLPTGCVKLFEDETDLLLFPPLRAGWFLRGQPAEVPISGENAKRTIFGTIDVDTGDRILVARDGACAGDFHEILRLIRQKHEGKKVAVLLDKASRHTAHESETLAAEFDIELIWLPSRCVNINPMDRLWRWGKDKICANKQYLSIDYQAEFFMKYLLGLSAQEALRKAGILSGRFWLFR
jgi:transposase